MESRRRGHSASTSKLLPTLNTSRSNTPRNTLVPRTADAPRMGGVTSEEDTDYLSGEPVRPTTPIHSFSQVHDPTVSWFYTPASLTIFGIITSILCVVAYSTDYLKMPERIKSHLGLLTAIASFELFCMLNARDGPFARPHPAFWRAVLGANFMYFTFLCYLYYQEISWIRTTVVPYFDPSLGTPVHHQSHALNCDVTYKNVKNQALELFALAHAVGWFGKALILRDWWLLNILSVTYELIEYSLAHHLPEFEECWWDHWLLDVCGCNFIGSFIGMKFCKFLAVSHFSWRGARHGRIRNVSARMVEQMTPFDFANFSWESVKRFRNYLSTVIMLAVFLTSEVNIFYLKHLLWIPSDHPLVVIRLMFMFLWALPATREFYEYVNHSKRVVRMGMHVWLLVATVVLELLCVIKWSKGEFKRPMPRAIKLSWTVFAILLVVYPIVKFAIPAYKKRQRKQSRSSHSQPGIVKSTST